MYVCKTILKAYDKNKLGPQLFEPYSEPTNC